MKVGIKYDKRVFRFIRELEDRVQAIQKLLPQDISGWYIADVKRRLPDKEYTSALERFKAGESYGVWLNNRKKEKESGTFTYINPSATALVRMGEVAKFLQLYSPWTPTTCPEIPTKLRLWVTFKKVTPQEEETRDREINSKKLYIRRELVRLGLRPGKNAQAKNLVAEGATKEFGFGVQAKPHWKPALTKLENELGRVWKVPKYMNMLGDIRSRMWKNRPTWEYAELREAEVTQLEPFIKKLVG